MVKTSTMHIRIDPVLKVNTEKILNQLGITTSEAINIFFNQICIKQGMPFEISIHERNDKGEMKKAKRKSLSGYLEEYSNPDLIPLEESVWEREVEKNGLCWYKYYYEIYFKWW